MDAGPLPSTRPYLIRALHEWCSDAGFTPHLLVRVGSGVKVPMEFVRDGEITLNVSLSATQGLQLGNEWIEFKARFGGVAREIAIPVEQVLAIFARENGQGMSFPPPQPEPENAGLSLAAPLPDGDLADNSEPGPPPSPPPTRPTLKRVK